MRKLAPLVLALIVVLAFVGTLVFLYQKSREPPVAFETKSPVVRDVIAKTVATGAIVPRREVAIKARVSGVLEELPVVPGQYVKAGDLIAKIKIIPNVVAVNSAEARLDAARISLKNAESEQARFAKLFAQQLVTQSEFNRVDLDLKLSRQELVAARNNLELVKNGAIRGSGKVSNEVHSTVEGMVIEVPMERGGSVIEANNFNEGTTIASVADMNDMVFEGHVDESEVGKLKEGMPVSISIGALEGSKFKGKLEYIAPKGVEKDGTIEFEVRARLELKEGTFIRANYSANADVILDRRDKVTALSENLIQFDKGEPYVEIETAPQEFEKQSVKLGLSDGLYVEVLDGLSPKDRVKVFQPTENGHKPR